LLRRPFCAWTNPSPGTPTSGGTAANRCGWRWTLDALRPAASVAAEAGVSLEAEKVSVFFAVDHARRTLPYGPAQAPCCGPSVADDLSPVSKGSSLMTQVSCLVQEPVDVWERAGQLRAMLSRIGAST